MTVGRHGTHAESHYQNETVMIKCIIMLYVKTMLSFNMMLSGRSVVVHMLCILLGITKYSAGTVQSQVRSMQVPRCVKMMLSHHVSR